MKNIIFFDEFFKKNIFGFRGFRIKRFQSVSDSLKIFFPAAKQTFSKSKHIGSHLRSDNDMYASSLM